MILSRHLSLQLLLLLLCSIFLVQVLLAIPLIAEYRVNWLNKRLTSLQNVRSMVQQGETQRETEQQLSKQLSSRFVDIYSIKDDGRNIPLHKGGTPQVDASFHLLDTSFFQAIPDALDTLFSFGERTIEISTSDTFIVVMDERYLFNELLAFVQWLSILSVVFLIVVSGVSYFVITRIFLSPLQKIQHSLVSFRLDSEDDDNIVHIIKETSRQDELGVVQNQLSRMQSTVYTALRQTQRLSTLGTAVAKIHHDLSNILQTAVLLSGRLAGIVDPEVKRVAPKLVKALDRAGELSEQILSYARDGIVPLRRTYFAPVLIIDEVESYIRLSERRRALRTDVMEWQNKVDHELIIYCDREQMMRVFMNLARNAHQAEAKKVLVYSQVEGEYLQIIFADNGPGLSEQIQKNLFRPFVERAKLSGTGLGLSIAYEILRSHSGHLSLMDAEYAAALSMSTAFLLQLPKDVIVKELTLSKKDTT